MNESVTELILIILRDGMEEGKRLLRIKDPIKQCELILIPLYKYIYNLIWL